MPIESNGQGLKALSAMALISVKDFASATEAYRALVPTMKMARAKIAAMRNRPSDTSPAYWPARGARTQFRYLNLITLPSHR
jgi:hypothetical protein